jgi:hypothetical protein
MQKPQTDKRILLLKGINVALSQFFTEKSYQTTKIGKKKN